MDKMIPYDICKIVYRYIYDTILNQLKEVYGKTLILKIGNETDECENIKANSIIYNDGTRGWMSLHDHHDHTTYITNLALWASKAGYYEKIHYVYDLFDK